jgi:hypothetical protein
MARLVVEGTRQSWTSPHSVSSSRPSALSPYTSPLRNFQCARGTSAIAAQLVAAAEMN